jgi:hypothetical protein
MSARWRDVFDDGVEERLHRAADVLQIELGKTFFGAGIDDWKIHLLVGRVKGDEQIPNGVEHFVWIGIVAIDFVDHDNRLRAGFEGFAEDETGLSLGTIRGINDKQHAVDHVHDTLDFAAEIGVAGSIDDIDVVILIFEGGVFGADGNALFALKIHGIHDALFGGDGLVGAERAGLLEEAIDERGFPVVDVGDNGDISNVLHV